MAVLTEEQTKLVQQTWDKVKESGPLPEIGRWIFIRFFELSPEALELTPFPEETPEGLKTNADLRAHTARFARYMDLAVKLSGDFEDKASATFTSLGNRHSNVGATRLYFQNLGIATVDVVGSLLGEDFTPEVKEAWVQMYDVISDTMQAAMTSDK